MSHPLQNWRCVCGRGPSIEHQVNGYCSGKEVINRLQKELDGVLGTYIREEAAQLEYDERQKRKLSEAHAMADRLAEALNKAFVSLNFEFDEDRKLVRKEVVKTLAAYESWKGGLK